MPPLEPQLELPRARVDRRLLVLSLAVIAISAGALAVGMRGPRVVTAMPTPVSVPYPVMITTVVEAPLEASPSAIVRGTCDTSMIPPGYKSSLTDSAAAELAREVGAWVGGPAWQARPAIAYARGVVFVESAEDRGDDPPYPRSAAPEATRVCGSAARWLRSHLRDQLAVRELVCDGNVCCYGSSEYAPAGVIVFRPPVDDDDAWQLDAWIQYYDAALGPDLVAENLRFVTGSLGRLAPTRCAGEPRGVD
jgi:hypothetical protein